MSSITLQLTDPGFILYFNEGLPGAVTADGTAVLTNKGIDLTDNDLTGTLAEFNAACSDADFATLAGTETFANKTIDLTDNDLAGTLAEFNAACSDADFATLDGAETLSSKSLSDLKTVAFEAQTVLATTSGAVTIDWSAHQNYKQTEPTGSITYTFIAPSAPAKLQLVIDSDGTSTAQTIVWPGTVIQLGTTWAGANNKKGVVNFWYDGASYYAMGSNQV